MPRVTIWLDDQHVKALATAAVEARRRPADQAAVLVEQALADRQQQSKSKEAVATT
jgi:hypothetical protein